MTGDCPICALGEIARGPRGTTVWNQLAARKFQESAHAIRCASIHRQKIQLYEA